MRAAKVCVVAVAVLCVGCETVRTAGDVARESIKKGNPVLIGEQDTTKGLGIPLPGGWFIGVFSRTETTFFWRPPVDPKGVHLLSVAGAEKLGADGLPSALVEGRVGFTVYSAPSGSTAAVDAGDAGVAPTENEAE